MNYMFDLYGTLIDIWTNEEKLEVWQSLADNLGETDPIAVRNEYKALCASAKHSEFHEINLKAVFEEMLISRDMDKSTADKIASDFRAASMERLGAFRGVKTMLRRLGEVGRVYLVSNAQSCFTIDELKSTGLYDIFDGIVISSDVGVKKPSPEIFEIALNRFGIEDKDSCIYVGNDMRDDVLGATRAGIKSLYIPTAQSGSYPTLNLPEPTFSVKSHRQMEKILLSLA